MKKLKLVSPIPPSVNNYLNYKVASAPNNRKFVQAYPSEQTISYKRFFTDYVKDQMKEQDWTRPEKGKLVYVMCTFYLDRKRKDPNNFLKVPLDVFSEAGVYVDDDIALPVVPRLYIDSKNPRIEFEIYESSSIGVFKDKEELDKFMKENCSVCKKDASKCSVLKKLLDNRIIDDSNNLVCRKKRPI